MYHVGLFCLFVCFCLLLAIGFFPNDCQRLQPRVAHRLCAMFPSDDGIDVDELIRRTRRLHEKHPHTFAERAPHRFSDTRRVTERRRRPSPPPQRVPPPRRAPPPAKWPPPPPPPRRYPHGRQPFNSVRNGRTESTAASYAK